MIFGKPWRRGMRIAVAMLAACGGEDQQAADDTAAEILGIDDFADEFAVRIGHQQIGGGQREVVYTFLGQRFATIVDERTLQVRDAGICLDGADRELTLESLPGVIREAVDTGELFITRRVQS